MRVRYVRPPLFSTTWAHCSVGMEAAIVKGICDDILSRKKREVQLSTRERVGEMGSCVLRRIDH